MLGLITTLGGALIDQVGGYFKTKQEIKKVKTEAEKEVIVAKAKAEVKRLEKESEQDYNLDMEAMKDMRNSWKDELILVIFLAPLVLSFIPATQAYVFEGFKALEQTPDWYRYILIGMIVVIYGMRGLLKYVLKLIISKKGGL